MTDYVEIYIHGTSAYLEDTDSDGDLDGVEIAAKENPNCPKDQNCAPTTSGGLPAENTNQDGVTGSTPAGEDVDADALRQTLLQQGMDPNLLNQIDDKTLKELYNETAREQTIPADNPAAAANDNSNTAKTPVGNLTADQVRALLIENGADPKES